MILLPYKDTWHPETLGPSLLLTVPLDITPSAASVCLPSFLVRSALAAAAPAATEDAAAVQAAGPLRRLLGSDTFGKLGGGWGGWGGNSWGRSYGGYGGYGGYNRE
jgi:hypothetical protein